MLDKKFFFVNIVDYLVLYYFVAFCSFIDIVCNINNSWLILYL